MKTKMILTVSVLLMICAGCSDNKPTQQERFLSKELKESRDLIKSAREEILDSKSDAKRLDTDLQKSTAVMKEQDAAIKSMQARIADFEHEEFKRKLDEDEKSAQEKYHREIMAKIQAPEIVIKTNRFGGEEKTYIFPKICDKNEQRITLDATFSSLIGRHLTFSVPSGQRVSFDVDEIHPAILLHLNIDAANAKDRQNEFDAANKIYIENAKRAGEEAYNREMERRSIEAMAEAQRQANKERSK